MSDDEDCDLVYDLLQEAESIGDNYKEVSANGYNSDEENRRDEINDVSSKKYRNNPKLNPSKNDDENEENDNNDESPLDDLLNLIDDESNESEQIQPKKIPSKPSNPKKEVQEVKKIEEPVTTEKKPPPPPQQSKELILVDKNTRIRIAKPAFQTESELNMRLTYYGQFYKISQLRQSMKYLKEVGTNTDWFSVFLVGSKTEPKCSAKGNKFIIWHIYDLDSLDREQEVSLFLFGAAYQSFWKAGEFEVYAVLKPSFLDSDENNSKSTSSGTTKKNDNFHDRISLCVRNEAQLVKLGITKDVSRCQSVTRSNKDAADQSKNCRKLVNLQRGSFCTYHCMQNNKASKSSYSMDKLWDKAKKYSPQTNAKPFVNNPFPQANNRPFGGSSFQSNNNFTPKPPQTQTFTTSASINKNNTFHQESSFSQAAKTNKKSDSEMLSYLSGKSVENKETFKSSLFGAQSQRLMNYGSNNKPANSFGSPKIATSNVNKPMSQQEATDTKSVLQQKLDEVKKQSSMKSESITSTSNLLKKQIDAIKKFDSKPNEETKTPSKPAAANSGFDLEFHLGSPSSDKVHYGPKLFKLGSDSGQKRKKPESECEDPNSKKTKIIDDLLKIKSTHHKNVFDSEKNPHYKAYLSRLEQQERIDEKLTSMRNQEVKAVTCATCSYTAFKQSEFCKLKRHEIKFHQAIQRFFKCKTCNKRTYTLDKICPVSSCAQCGSDRFEPCTFKEHETNFMASRESLTTTFFD